MNIKEVKEMINLMNENNLTELELEREGLKIRIKRGTLPGSESPNIVIERLKAQANGLEYATPVEQFNEPTSVSAAAGKSNLVEIKSPMVGTFYRAPSPEASSFVEVATEIEIGQVICIIEAMKLMNEIKSEVKGTVKEILVNNGDPVEFGQVLFKIEPV
ncbi:MAG: acetyl-CoA carboxylase biotin carboxyl carrier protein [Candidatus Omnitrophica bacterium]|nr:acetyl-CoA carboxylase biotin carboxyl carrier protein [Candidatus Omnitrophota bacterium]MBU1925087.1 acetyl-CoA carboxylase biotin carboxyl carrier protein [Candidatus Omnitrophota bacterium]